MNNPFYRWHGMTYQGQFVSSDTARKKMTWPRLRKNKIRSIDIIVFFQQLSTLIIAGIPLAQAMHILSQQEEQANLLMLTISLKETIMAGNGLAHGLKKFPRHFDDVTCQLIQAGEKTGTLDKMLERVAAYKEKIAAIKNKVIQALFYPAIISFIAIAVTVIMLTFVVPRFAELFQSMHSNLPTLTLGVIAIANFFQQHIIILLFLMMLLSVLIYYTRDKLYKRLLNCPGLGMLVKKFMLARFAHSLATLFSAGIPLSEALNILSQTISHATFRQVIKKLQRDIHAGKQLHLAMQESQLFPAMMLQMVQVGEESGTLEKMLLKIAEFYEADIDRAIAHLGRLLEPLIMVILGVLIGGLVIAMYLPIFKLGTVI
jgi:type IV pilus assembly protein PilC